MKQMIQRQYWISKATLLLGIVLVALVVIPVAASSYGPMMAGKSGYTTSAAFTVGETIDGYQPIGILDGTAAYDLDENTVRVLVNHEAGPSVGYAYQLASGAEMSGARVSYMDIDKTSREIVTAGLAYSAVYDRSGELVTDASQINEIDGNSSDGFARFCSAQGYAAGQYGFVDNIYLTGEETSASSGHPHGGSVWALDVDAGELWAVPALGRGAWENVTAVNSGSRNHVAILLGDDTAGAPLYLYVGEKNALGDGSFLDRNGLAVGNLFVWRSNTRGQDSPETFNSTGSVAAGHFVPVQVRDIRMAGQAGYDAAGYLDDTTLRQDALDKGAFAFSRPEDVHTNPYNDKQVVMASTGRGQLFPSDNWGTIYQIDLRLRTTHQHLAGLGSAARLTILHDADDYGDYGIRSADNLVWATDGNIYVQEDRSTSPGSLFGGTSGREASIWQLNPHTLAFEQIAEMNRTAVAPTGSTDSAIGDIGNWESSGILDVTNLFPTAEGELLFIGTVQAHSVRDGVIADNNLAEGGQLIFISHR